MEHNHKNLDCYFFYYSTCKKGDFCPYRHEPSALGCETMCTYWQQGNCLNEHCNFRHMELKKNRKSIPCYWETQPGGCRKPHCPFMHTSPRTISGDPINPVKTTEVATKSPNQEWLNRQDDPKYDGSSTTESDQGRGNSEAGSFIGSPVVDPLIVKFEEATLSLPPSLQTNMNLPNALNIPKSLTIPNNPNSLNIPGNISVANNLNVPPANSQSSPCHHTLSYPHHQQNLHSHSSGQSLSSLQNQQSSPLLQQSPYTSIHTQQTSQPQTSRFPFPFLESDNESAPSPVKSQPKVPYCKTYEQMRLEEIQAESAAYYSYEASNYGLHQKQMSETIGTKRWIRTSKMKKEELSKELNFKILSLEEIRQRKKERAARTLTDIMSMSEPSTPIEAKSMKRRSIDEQCDKESANSAKRYKISSELFAKNSEPVVKVQPIKLRRSLKMETQIQPCEMQIQTEIQPCEDVTINKRLAMGSQDQTSCCEEKQESHSNETSYCGKLENYVGESTNRKVDIEIRLCDSSTNEEKTQVPAEQASNDRSSVATYTEDIETSLLTDQPYDQQYTQTDEEYLRLDTSADDIMRDIEDLLN
ncbi:Zinc finger CCCH domain-containing protein 11A [Trachymyrmex septentrionalis]|uniref:Zinc finger CCCH domain-containing protein 11A n=1 Tax=Trachymyrmex septentrionalis TaxID=34720 RepID=A0A195FIS3_9HYME|nr:Zinc finger CCCH domain-containing protein 11A [Trachymyrmex septentrionalis]